MPNTSKPPIRIEGDVAYVPLTKGYEAVIDAADVPLVAAFSWHAFVQPHTVYAGRGAFNQRPATVMLHRALLGADSGLDVDHIDNDGLNNRRANLRFATRSQNMCNSRTPSNNKSGFKGVSWHKASNRWRAQLGFSGEKYHLGYFEMPEAAYAACVSAREQLHREFAKAA